ncbi:MAG TPA: TIGR02678 family protein [Ktedonobacteraceae bacterium]|nr:TIGR02678 family protein [Ktedonobacteraceae bacterium]
MIEEHEMLAMSPPGAVGVAYLPETASPALPEQSNGSGNRAAFARQRASTAELLKAHTGLMEREVILSQQSELFRLVNRHYFSLQNWHDQHTGWRIQRSATVIRLVRQLSAVTPGYLYDRLKEPGDFACLTWILWYAETRQLSGRGNDQQFLLSQLAEQIQEQSSLAGDDGEAAFDFRRPADRYSIQRALQYLENIGGLRLVDGQTREWVEQTADADVLYEFTDVIRSLVSAFNPQLLALVAERLNDNEQEQALQPTLLQEGESLYAAHVRPLTRAWRALLLGPALFRFDDADAFAELVTHAEAVANELLDTFGWQLDVKRDYACVTRASGMSSGPVTTLTPYGASDQLAMLLCTAIREQVQASKWTSPDRYGCLHVTTEDMNALFYILRERYGENWGSDARARSARSLLNDVYKKMRQVGLLRGPDSRGNVLILPTAARYSVNYDIPAQETKTKTRQTRRATTAALPGWNGDEQA